MKVICINRGSYHLTVNKIYEVRINDTGMWSASSNIFDYVIVNDRGYEHFIESDLFKNLDEVREEKIKIIFNI